MIDDSGGGLGARPVEDRGHETAVWYDFQYACTAMECLGLLADPEGWVLCEWHTDYVAATPAALPAALVSVKHKSPDQGAWRLSQLAGAGGLAVLYARWDAAGRKHRCRMATNAGFAPQAGDARDLKRLLDAGASADDVEIKVYAESLAGALGAPDDETAARFLASLRFVSYGADGYAIAARGVEHARSVLERTGYDQGYARVAYDVAVGMVKQAVVSCDPVAPPSGWLFGDEAADAIRAARTITWELLKAALTTVGVPVAAPYSSSPTAGGDTVLGRKLRAGGLGPSALTNAPRLRQQWYTTECGFRSDLPSRLGDPVEATRSAVVAQASGAEAVSRSPGVRYAPQMYLELERRLGTVVSEFRWVGTDDLIGCAYQLTDECAVWWSDEFDTSLEAPWTRPQSSEGPP